MTITDTRNYGTFEGDGVNPEDWFFYEIPLPEGTHVFRDPSARIEVDGGLRVTVERFELGGPAQLLDNAKMMLISTEEFEVPESGKAVFSADISARPINATPYDYRDGFVSFIVSDPINGWVFDLATSGDMALAIHERLAYPGIEHSFTRIVNDPLADVEAGHDKVHHCEITLDRAAGTVTWVMDGVLLHEATTEVPATVRLGLGIFTLHKVDESGSTSLRGQGISGSWSNVSVTN